MTLLAHAGVMVWAAAWAAWAQDPAPPIETDGKNGPEEATAWAGWAALEGGARVRALERLGRKGSVEDIPTLLAELQNPWPVGAAAGYALGELGRRQVDGVGVAIPDLVRALGRMDPRTRIAAAYGIKRIGLAQATDAAVAQVQANWAHQRQPEARAWLLEALSKESDAARRADLWFAGVEDASRLVQVAGLRYASEGLDPAVLTAFLEDHDPWIRLEAARALGRATGDVADQALAAYRGDGRDPWSHVVSARARPGEGDFTSGDPHLRAAHARLLGTRGLDALVENDPSSIVRVAAASVARERHGTRERGLRYLRSQDPLVQALGADILAEHGAPRDLADLVNVLGGEEPEEVLRASLAAITSLSGGEISPALRARLQPYASHSALRVQVLLDKLGISGAPEKSSTPSPASPSMAHVQTTRGMFIIELRSDWAPLAVANFKDLAISGFFDGQRVHRVVPGFVTQTGCPRGDGWGGPGHTIPDELTRVPFERGAVGMARAEPHSGGSQWFVTHSAQPHLAGQYTQFGRVVQGRHVPERLTIGDKILRVQIKDLNP